MKQNIDYSIVPKYGVFGGAFLSLWGILPICKEERKEGSKQNTIFKRGKKKRKKRVLNAHSKLLFLFFFSTVQHFIQIRQQPRQVMQNIATNSPGITKIGEFCTESDAINAILALFYFTTRIIIVP